jgi:hypothetical protein
MVVAITAGRILIGWYGIPWLAYGLDTMMADAGGFIVTRLRQAVPIGGTVTTPVLATIESLLP